MNRAVIISAFVLGGAGIVKAWQGKTSVTRVLLGSYIFILVMAAMDMFGGGLSTLASALSMLAVVFVLVHDIDWTSVIQYVQGKK